MTGLPVNVANDLVPMFSVEPPFFSEGDVELRYRPFERESICFRFRLAGAVVVAIQDPKNERCLWFRDVPFFPEFGAYGTEKTFLVCRHGCNRIYMACRPIWSVDDQLDIPVFDVRRETAAYIK